MTLTAPSAEEVAATVVPDYAGLATRTIAFGADALLINVVIWFVGAVVGLGLSLLGVPEDILVILAVIGAGVALLFVVGYFTFFWSANGQTPGDRMMGIQIQGATTGEPPHAARAFVRVCMLPVAALPLCAGFLMILVDSRRRALQDVVARTVVVYTPRTGRRLSVGRRPG